jgi:ATP-binding cassette subfamily F protein 3
VLARIDATLAEPSTFAGDPAKAVRLTRERDAAQAAVDLAETEWLEAQEAYEALRASA